MHISQLSVLSLAAHVAADPCKPEASKSHDTSSLLFGTTLDISSAATSIASSIETTYTISDIESSSTASVDSSSTETTSTLISTTTDTAASSTVLQSTTTEATTSTLPKETTPAEIFRGGFATWYTQNGGMGDCGWVNRDDELVVALDMRRFQRSLCGQKLRVSTVDGAGSPISSVDVTIVTSCPTCINQNSLDLSMGAFTALGSLSDGQSAVIWQWI